jgi:hypothetical protein
LRSWRKARPPWDRLGKSIGGWKTFHVGQSGQDYFSRPLSAEADAKLIEGRVAFIDQLLTVASRPEAVQALQQARKVLVGETPGRPTASATVTVGAR